MTFKTNPAGRSLANRALVMHLRSNGPCSFNDLFVLFGNEPEMGFDAQKARFRKRIDYLMSQERITVTEGGTAGNRMFAAAPEYAAVERAAISPTPPTPLAPPCTQRVPARQVDVMNGPIYVPQRTQLYRHGAMDFKSVPSRGHRC